MYCSFFILKFIVTNNYLLAISKTFKIIVSLIMGRD